jgi:hypothetical protein
MAAYCWSVRSRSIITLGLWSVRLWCSAYTRGNQLAIPRVRRFGVGIVVAHRVRPAAPRPAPRALQPRPRLFLAADGVASAYGAGFRGHAPLSLGWLSKSPFAHCWRALVACAGISVGGYILFFVLGLAPLAIGFLSAGVRAIVAVAAAGLERGVISGRGLKADTGAYSGVDSVAHSDCCTRPPLPGGIAPGATAAAHSLRRRPAGWPPSVLPG